jgi:hypothetical protein
MRVPEKFSTTSTFFRRLYSLCCQEKMYELIEKLDGWTVVFGRLPDKGVYDEEIGFWEIDCAPYLLCYN